MPLGSSNYRNVTEDVQEADDVLLSVRPSTVAMAEDWNTEIVRRPDSGGSPSTDPDTEVRVATRPAGQRVVVDRSVPSTTAKSWWRARHVRPGSTAGEWTDWQGGNPREDADSAIHSSLNVAQLDVITNDIGKLTAGTLANTTGTRFINLSATGNNDFIHVEDASGTTTLSIQADGDADFGGVVSSSRFTANNALFENGGIRTVGNGGISGSTWRGDYDERALTFGEGFTNYGEIRSSTGTNALSVIARNGNLVLNPASSGGRISIRGGNLSTDGGTLQEYLTVETTAGTRKIALQST